MNVITETVWTKLTLTHVYVKRDMQETRVMLVSSI